MMDFMTATLEELRTVPFYFEQGMEFDRLIFVPLDSVHESGFRMMSYILCLEGKIIGRIGICSDVLHVDGIGGYGEWEPSKGLIPLSMPLRAWNMDCLPVSQCICLFCRGGMRLSKRFDKISNVLSDIEIFGREEK